MVNNDKQESTAYRRQVISQLYKRTNDSFASELLSEPRIISAQSLKLLSILNKKTLRLRFF